MGVDIEEFEHDWYCGKCKYSFITIEKEETVSKNAPCPLCRSKYTITTGVKKIN